MLTLPSKSPLEAHDIFDHCQDISIAQLFEFQVERTPDAIAVVFEGKQLTYRELNCQANQVAHHLKTVGVGPEVLVGICVERSLAMIAGLLGVLKAGGAYVPLDPAYPRERLAFMLKDAQAPVLLTQARWVPVLSEHKAKVVCLDTDWEAIATKSEDNPSRCVRSNNIAYVIYTSGSTGKPKGVLVEHWGLCNLARAQIQLFNVQPDSRILQFASFSFDASVWEIFMALVAGATLCLGTRESLLPGLPLIQILRDQAITTITLPPSVLATLSDEELPALRTVIVAGEICSPGLMSCWSLGRRFFNAYGPTEATVCATVAECNNENYKLPIGSPIANTQVYLLNAQLQPVPTGALGEIYIGGVGLARGYLNRPDLTAERFIPNPFSNVSGDRLYKTGDLARYLPDGNIKFLGRIDQQVKIRGFRIEPGEIEAALSQHPDVRDAAVIAREDVPGNKILVAYLVSTLFEDISQRAITQNLRSFLKRQLPHYMVPTSFVFLSALPLTPNGKVDRQALLAHSKPRTELAEDFEAPRTHLEEMVAGIWAEVLGLEWVSIQDNFLELGGHSLLATQVISRVRDTFQVELPLRCLFDAPTVAKLAESIETVCRQDLSLQASPIQSILRDQNLPLSFAQQRLWFLNQLVPNNPFYNVSEGVRLTGPLNVVALQHSISEIIRRHEVLRTTFETMDGQPIQIIHPASTFRLTVVDLQRYPKTEREAQARQLATKETQQIFDLFRGPLLRISLLQLDVQEYILLLNFHHILCDDWSCRVFFQELTVIYKAFVDGMASPLPELAIQYADFAVWQRQRLQGEVRSEQIAYWRQQLADLPKLQLPTDRPRPLVPTYQGARQSLMLPKTLTDALIRLSQQEDVTLFMTLLAAFQTLLFRYTGSEDIPVGTAIANRHPYNVEELVGFFVNTLVLRTNLSGSLSFRQLLDRVRDVALGAYAYQDLPFEQLVAELQPERDLSHHPLFQVVFALQNIAPIDELSLPGLKKNLLEIHNGTAKFDLFLQLLETPTGLTGYFEYSTDLFDVTTISRMVSHFQTLLEGIVVDPDRCLAELPLLTAAERQTLLVEWNDTHIDYPIDACIHQLVEAQVERMPNTLAVVFEGEQLTYQELNQRANQLAHYLKTLGVGPEVLVGLYVERSLEMIVGILGILKAGGAFVPLDPNYPLSRLAFILTNAEVQVLLTQGRLVPMLSECGVQVVCLDSDWDANTYSIAISEAIQRKMPKARVNMNNPISGVTPDNLAYIIHTSGSTGSPKGVLVEHRKLCNLAQAQSQLFNMQPDSRVLQFASLSFDASVSEIFMALVKGATLCLGVQDSLLPGLPLIQLLRDQAITIVTLPPSVLAALPAEELPVLRTIIVAGEACSPDLVSHWAPGRRFFNAYGPTEATVCATVAECTGVNQKLPIGYPIAKTHVYLLDAQLQPVPIGVPGEIYIGGAGLARGYLNRPDLTAERFIPNPFSTTPGDRLYKTGDLARYLSDGNIEFLGRIDQQVKIRGFRIEPGEIEAVLNQHPDVQQTVVMAREDVLGDRRLVAYIVPDQGDVTPIQEQDNHEQKRIELWPSVAEYFVYDELLYYAMTTDERRNHSYKVAINQLVKDKVVVEVGTGPNAILARFCVEAGAKRVYAIEMLDATYRRAEACINALGLQDKITLILGGATKVELPEKADVCVSEIVGPIGGCEGAAVILNNARRFLNEDGVMIPERSITQIAAVCLPNELSDELGFTNVAKYYVEKIFEQVGHPFDLRLCIKNFSRANLISNSEIFEALDFASGCELECSSEIELTIKKNSRFDGFLVWLNLHTIDGEVIDILEHEYCWLPVYFPVFHPGIEVSEGDVIKAFCSREISDNNLNPDYKIRGELIKRSGTVVNFSHDSYHHKSLFRQTPFYKQLFSQADISTNRTNHPEKLVKHLREYLREHLPDYMVPSAFVMLDALPLTLNGKLDRRALPPPDKNRPELEAGFVAPRTPVEQTLAEIWAKVLGVDRIGIHDNFLDLGGHSLQAAQLLIRLQEVFQIELPIRCLFETPTVAGLAQTIEVMRGGNPAAALASETLDLQAEAVLDDEIHAMETPYQLNEPCHIFLTGATGFLGAFLLDELLRQTQAKIYCLVRSPNEREGLKRLQSTLEKYSLWNQSLSRIVPIPGDLAQPLLGLSREHFDRLAAQIDTIYHSGGQVNFVQPYSLLKAANVLGTHEVLRLACRGRVKPVHYISTGAIFGATGYFTGVKVIREEDNIDGCESHLYMGYSQSKWVAEKLVWIASSRGVPINIFRPGFIMGHSQTGITNTDDFSSKLVKGCIQIGSFPDLVDKKEEFIPVDCAARAIVYLSKRKESLGIFHLVPSQPIHFVEFFDLIRSYGYPLKKLPYTTWKNELIHHIKQSQENPLLPLLPMLTQKVFQEQLTLPELYQRNPHFDCQNTLNELAGTSITCPPLDAKLLDTYFSYFIRSGFLDSPLRSRTV